MRSIGTDPAGKSGSLLQVPDCSIHGGQMSNSGEERLVAFYLGRDLFGIPADIVCEIIQPIPVTPLPNSPQNLVGIAALRGEILAIINLRRMLGIVAAQPETRSKLIIIRLGIDVIPAALPVDRVHKATFVSSDAAETSQTPPCIAAVARTPLGDLQILNTQSLLAALSVS